jgi:phospho-N-acetylmuramoyl-pentapeptide-transferase
MLYYLHLLEDVFSPLRVFRYITVRAVAAAGTAFLLSMVIGPWLIRRLQRLDVRHVDREEVEALRHAGPPTPGVAPGASGPTRHETKRATPTMGGLLIILCIVLATLLWAEPANLLVWVAMATLLFMGAVGFWDDLHKVTERRSRGLSARGKFVLQTLWALAIVALLLLLPGTAERARQLMVPFLKTPLVGDMGAVGTFLFVALVLIGATNAVNLTDGLDGLAIGCSSSVALSYLVMAYAAGHVAFAEYLNIPYVRGAGELSVFSGAMMGACLGFLWYNCHPARVFMGDTGSLALGGGIAIVAILVKQELVLIIVGGVFVMEAASVIIQVVSFKTRGKRVFAMAPIHHHFEKKQWSETQVVVRFWILSIIFALLGILTLKIR